MDIFCEYLVKRKSSSDFLKRITLFVSCVVVCILVFYIGFFILPQFVAAVPILIAAAIYGAVIYSRNFSIEYEYVFTNGVLDIDVIKGRVKRSNLISVPCRKIEYMGRLPKNYSPQHKVIDAVFDYNRSGKYVATISLDSEKVDVLFQPPEKILVNMKKYNPRNINL